MGLPRGGGVKKKKKKIQWNDVLSGGIFFRAVASDDAHLRCVLIDEGVLESAQVP